MHLKSCSLRGQQDKPLIALENSPPYRLPCVLCSSTGSVGRADAGRLQQSRRKGDFGNPLYYKSKTSCILLPQSARQAAWPDTLHCFLK